MSKNLSREVKRELFMSYQNQFYNEECMQSMIEQSDQYRVIRAGGYDDFIEENWDKIQKYFNRK